MSLSRGDRLGLHPLPTSQLADPDQEDQDQSLSPGSIESSPSFLDARSITLVNLQESSSNHALSVSINSETTFGDVYQEVGSNIVLLEPHFGPLPYWTEAQSTSTSLVGSTCSVLYCVNKQNAAQYTLAVVRSTLRDFPIVICQSGQWSAVPISQAIHEAFPLLAEQTYSITSYGSNRRVDSDIYDYERLKRDNTETFPTVFFMVGADEQSRSFISELPDKAIPSFLQGPVVYGQQALRKAYGLEAFTLSMVHISKSLLHAFYSLADAFAAYSVKHSDLHGSEDGGQREHSSLNDDFPQVALSVCHQLQILLDRTIGIAQELEQSGFNEGTASLKINGIFSSLCGDHPGAVPIRQSYQRFNELLSRDLEEHGEHQSQQNLLNTAATNAIPQNCVEENSPVTIRQSYQRFGTDNTDLTSTRLYHAYSKEFGSEVTFMDTTHDSTSAITFPERQLDPFLPDALNFVKDGIGTLEHTLSMTHPISKSHTVSAKPSQGNNPSFGSSITNTSIASSSSHTQGRYPCPVCSRSYPRAGRARDCANRDMGLQPYACGGRCQNMKCNKAYSSEAEFRRHVAPIESRNARCPQCGRTILRQNMARHKRNSCPQNA